MMRERNTGGCSVLRVVEVDHTSKQSAYKNNDNNNEEH